ncbi:phosphate transporter PHO1 homolog 3-like [Papaver somniferum]|uniref:phosphate transporter PHO1 homolog 3-like n=1 Tax=Papaver somniferum TaxID=3469 RepID=UPI000E6F83E7|nr:phosphate transporter PHO1 homolog 3-like [Papaver somniferum]
MKFEKVMRSQMVPEWQGAYMDYTSLRLILEDLKLFKFNIPPQHHSHATHQHQHHHHHQGGVAGIATLYRSFSGLVVARSTPSITTSKSINGTTTSTNNGHHHHHNNHHGLFHHDEEPVISVQSMRGHHHHDLEKGVPRTNQKHEKYEAKFLMSNEDGGEYEVAFFKTLDEEFNAVNKFYRDKVDEVMNEAAVLTKQMDALVAFRVKFEHPDQGKFEQLCKEIARSVSAFSVSSPRGASSSTEIMHLEVVQESHETRTRRSSVGEIEPSNDNDLKEKDNKEDDEGEEKPLEIIIPAHLEILSTVKINSPSGTARSTIKGILKKKRKNNLNFNKKNLKKAEEQLQSAFVHFYHKLQLLKSFSYLNLLAFSKTMKKYDKITSRHASKIYLHMVDNSYIGSSDDVTRLMDRVEASFIKHFSKSNRSEGMDILRSKKKKERHVTTFFSGLYSGCAISLLICVILVINLRIVIKKDGFTQYMETMFPLYSLFGFLVFHMLLYSAAIYFWKRYQINYPFIFGFKQGTELGDKEVFLLSTILATAALACVLANLDMELDISTKKYKAITELLPLALVSAILLIIICPFNIVYRSSRMFLLRTTFRAISAPLYKVTLSDFMLADQLSSQGQALRSVAFYICYYTSNDYKRRETNCKADVVYNSFYIALTAFPFWLRALQCFRRYFEEKNGMQGINGFKYLSIVLSVSMVTAYSKRHTMGLYVMAWISAISAAIVSIYWDIVFDWGLLQKNSKNPWLRDKLLVPHKSVYFGIMIMDVLLRFVWLQTVLNIQVSFLYKEAMVVVVACLEIFRRGVWNFFRIENEHLTNVGKFRAFTTVPLPFNYHELEDN